jgi:hypothetical protein
MFKSREHPANDTCNELGLTEFCCLSYWKASFESQNSEVRRGLSTLRTSRRMTIPLWWSNDFRRRSIAVIVDNIGKNYS